jgi:hypothetical protein
MTVIKKYLPSLEDFTPSALDYANSTQKAIAAKNLNSNRNEVGHKLRRKIAWTPPDPKHYAEEYYWDEIFAVIIDAANGSEESISTAENGVRTLLQGQFDNGFIPNIQNIGQGRRFDPERIFGFSSKEHSNYTQPPLLALGISKAYYARKNQEGDTESRAMSFLNEVYDDMKKAYVYLGKHRSFGSNDRRAFITHPHETGRDSDPTYRRIKPFLIPRKGANTAKAVDIVNAVLDYGQAIWLSVKLRRAGEDTEKAHGIFRAIDVMFNAMLVDNLLVAADLALQLSQNEKDQFSKDAAWFKNYANDIEQGLYQKNWFAEARQGKGAFYSTDKDGNPFTETGVNNLSALLLPNLSEAHLISLLDMLDTDFDVPYPLNSVTQYSRNFDPNNQQRERLWEGSTWLNINWYYSERGLKQLIKNARLNINPLTKFRLEAWAIRLAKSSKDLFKQNGAKEFYNPITGEAQRIYRVSRFAWSNLALIQTGVRLNYSEHELKQLVDQYSEYLKALNA